MPQSANDSREIVVFAPYALWAHHFGTDLEIIQDHLRAGDRVTALTCDRRMHACDINAEHDPLECLRCHGTQRGGRRRREQRPGRLRVESFYRLSEADETELDGLPHDFASVDELKSFRLDDFDIGMAALSSLVSLVRDPEPDLREHARLVQNLLRSGWMVFRSFQRLLGGQHVDRVYTFNARFAPLRGVLRACQQAGVDCYTHDRGHDWRHYALYPNTLPHDEGLFQQRVRQAWETASDPAERDRIASGWFEQRASGVAQSWFSFVADQDQGRLPADWRADRRNVVLFSSSEDEFVAINDRWSTSLYPSQLEAMRSILRSLEQSGDKLHLTLRIHPNLAGVRNDQVRQLHALQAPNLTVIPAQASVSSYALLRAADRVVTFRSTVGIEAVYWQVPSILVGSAFYRELGGTYNPATHQELLQLIQAELAPKDRAAALMYGYHSATFGTPFRHFQPSDFFAGTFRGTTLRPDRWDRARMWLRKRPRTVRREIVRLAARTRTRRSGRTAA